ncbi:hypothetical protein ACFL6H_04735, partial [Candidatus Latescibacterota bacterium]
DISEDSSYADNIISEDVDRPDSKEEVSDDFNLQEDMEEIDIEDISIEGSDDIPEAPPEDAADEETTPEKEIEDFAVQDIDEDDFEEASKNEENLSDGSHYLGLPVDDEEIREVENKNIGDLINDYVAAMKDINIDSDAEENEHAAGNNYFTNTEEIEPDHDEDISYDLETEEETQPVGEATATMAEIFVSQGLTSRAIEIYKILIKQKPDNEKVKIRLEELQKTLDTQSGGE